MMILAENMSSCFGLGRSSDFKQTDVASTMFTCTLQTAYVRVSSL